jgi:4-amino-4-deoxy-L-arabinose transferase-like glycosyltransferase
MASLYFGQSVTPMPGVADQISYHTLALRVIEGHGFSFGTGWWPATPANQPTAHWSYLYVLFLTAVYGTFGPWPVAARLVQGLVVGVLHPWLTFRIGSRLFGSRTGLVASAVVAVYAYFVYYAGALMTESFCILAALWSLDVAMRIEGAARESPDAPLRGLWLQLGASLALAVMLRQAMLFLVPVVVGWAGWRVVAARRGEGAGSGAWRRALSGSTVSLLVLAAVILPWTIRNYRAFDRFVLLNTNAGFAFFWGNHPIHGWDFMPLFPGDGSRYGELIPDDLRSLNEGALDRALLKQGLQFVVDDPVRYLRLSVGRVVEYVKFWPTPESGTASNVARVLSFGVCLPFMVAGVILALAGTGTGGPQGDRSLAGVGLVLAAASIYSLIHVLTWTLVRYRLPVDALLVPFAALAMTRAHDGLRGWLAPAARTHRR